MSQINILVPKINKPRITELWLGRAWSFLQSWELNISGKDILKTHKLNTTLYIVMMLIWACDGADFVGLRDVINHVGYDGWEVLTTALHVRSS